MFSYQTGLAILNDDTNSERFQEFVAYAKACINQIDRKKYNPDEFKNYFGLDEDQVCILFDAYFWAADNKTIAKHEFCQLTDLFFPINSKRTWKMYLRHDVTTGHMEYKILFYEFDRFGIEMTPDDFLTKRDIVNSLFEDMYKIKGEDPKLYEKMKNKLVMLLINDNERFGVLSKKIVKAFFDGKYVNYLKYAATLV